MSQRRSEFVHDEWRQLVVLCSGVSWDGPFASEKHLAMKLAERTPVLFVDPPMSVLTPVRRPALRQSLRSPRLRQVGPRLARLTPIAPVGVSRPLLRDAAPWATRRALRRAVRDLGGDVRAVIVASLDDVFGACNEPLRLFWGTDDFAAAGELMNLDSAWLGRREVEQLRKADIVTAVSQHLAERWRAMGNDVAVIPNGCDADAYAGVPVAPLPFDVTLQQPIAGFIGLLSDRIDLRHLEAVADTGRSLLLVGPRQDSFEKVRLEHLINRANVQWVGPKAFTELPSYFRIMSAGLTPYSLSRFNKASFPLKTLEYLAAGLPVISTDMPAARWLDTDLIDICSSPEEFALKTEHELASPVDPIKRQQRIAVAQQNSWSIRAQDFAKLLKIEV